MEDIKRVFITVISSTVVFAYSSLCSALTPREVVLLGSFSDGKQIVISREIRPEPNRTPEGVIQFRKYSRKSAPGFQRLKIDLWNSTYLIGSCEPLAGNSARPINQPLSLELRCAIANAPNAVKIARLTWKESKKKKATLQLQSWLSGDQSTEVRIDYDGIGG